MLQSQIVLRQAATAPTTCLARVSLSDGSAGGSSINAIYNPSDSLTLSADHYRRLDAGTHAFEFQVQCSSDHDDSLSIVDDGVYTGLEIFSAP